MHRRARNTGEDADVNITPLLDIVFILLIFFIVTATFLREQGIDVPVPQDCGDDCGETFPDTLTLALQEDGYIRLGSGRIIDAGSVKPVVQEFIAREPDGIVLVTAAPDSESGIAVKVMDQAADGGADGRITLSLQKTE